MKSLKIALAIAATAISAFAQLVPNPFQTIAGWDPFVPSLNAGNGTAALVSDRQSLWSYALPAPFAIGAEVGKPWALTGNMGAGNLSGFVLVEFWDDNGPLASATFTLPSLLPGTVLSTPTFFNTSALATFLIIAGDQDTAGGATGFNASLSQLSIIPEPSTVALALGGVALAGAVVYRRRKTA
jgi:hypothetical protein